MKKWRVTVVREVQALTEEEAVERSLEPTGRYAEWQHIEVEDLGWTVGRRQL